MRGVRLLRAGRSRPAGIRRYTLFFFSLAAAGYGLLLVRSATGGGSFWIQPLSVLLGAGGAFSLSFVPFDRCGRAGWVLTAFTLLLMLLTFSSLGYRVPGTDDQNWLQIPLGSRSFLFQPAELLKISFILSFSGHLSAIGSDWQHPRQWLPVLLHAALPALLVSAQGDDGNAVVFLCLAGGMLFLAGLPARFFLIGGAAAAAALPFVWSHLTPDKQERFLCLFQVEKYAASTGWQQQLALTALGSGGLWGRGFRGGSPSPLYARQNDFIFTVAGEEFGFLGALLVLFLLGGMAVSLLCAARRLTDDRARFFCLGLFVLLSFQSLINLGMSLRLFPVLGITLPFFSAGGSSVLTLFFGVGLALSAIRSEESTLPRSTIE